MKTNHQTYLARILAAAIFIFTTSTWAGQPTIEIVAYKHAPVITALKPLRDWLTNQGSKLRTIEIDMESPEAEKRLSTVGLKGHIPIVILVDGKYKHTRKDGSVVEFVSFPVNSVTSANTKAGWSIDDAQEAIKNR